MEKKEDLNFIKKNLNKNIKFTFEKKENSPTIVKTRYLDAYKNNKIMGIYKLNDEIISKKVEIKLLSKLKKLLKTCDLIVVADYGHGLFSEKIRNELQNLKIKCI